MGPLPRCYPSITKHGAATVPTFPFNGFNGLAAHIGQLLGTTQLATQGQSADSQDDLKRDGMLGIQ